MPGSFGWERPLFGSPVGLGIRAACRSLGIGAWPGLMMPAMPLSVRADGRLCVPSRMTCALLCTQLALLDVACVAVRGQTMALGSSAASDNTFPGMQEGYVYNYISHRHPPAYVCLLLACTDFSLPPQGGLGIGHMHLCVCK